MADKNYKLTFGLSDGTQKSVSFTAPQGPTGKSAYEHAKDGGYKGTEAEFAAKMAAPGSGIQANLAQNDTTQPDYVKNRTHYKEEIPAATLYDGSVKFITSMGSITGIDNTKLETGKTYRVTWNGKAYDCVAYRTGDTLLGNLALMYAGDDTGEPFCLEKFSSNGSTVIKNSETAETVTLKVEIPAEVIYHKIPKEYLPDDIGGGVSSWNDLTDKPFGEEDGLVEILPETKLSNNILATTLPGFELTVGETYRVTYGGNEYNMICKAYAAGDITVPYLGNLHLLDQAAEDTGEPFGMGATPGGGTISEKAKTEQNTIMVRKDGTVINKLPVEFLPDGVPYLVEGANAEILPETPIIGEGEDSSEYFFMEGVTAPIIGGNTYTVKYNGVEYQCVAVEMTEEGMTAHFLGNYAAMTGTGDTGEPFIAIVLPAEYVASWGVGGMVMSVDGSTPETIAISGSVRTVRKLPNELLDLEWIPTKQSAGVVLIPEVTASGTGYVKDIGSRDFLPYDRVIVVFDGVEYECYPQFSDDGNIKDAFMTISNVPDASLIPGENPDQKFLIMGVSGQTSLIPSDGGTHTYLIKTAEYNYNKLDNGYLNLDWLPVRGTKEIFRPTVFKHNKATYGGTIFDLTSIIVNYEGIEYSCPVRFETAEEAAEAADVCSASNHLFALWSLRGSGSVNAYFADGADHFLSILDGESYNQMPEGYLPESVDGVVIRSSTEGSSKKFKLTVDDSGTITATEV